MTNELTNTTLNPYNFFSFHQPKKTYTSIYVLSYNARRWSALGAGLAEDMHLRGRDVYA